MDKLSGTQQQTKNSKKTKQKKEPIKVVYISNPVKFQATTSEFRDLVQKFTGQDSNLHNLFESSSSHEPPGQAISPDKEQNNVGQYGLVDDGFDAQLIHDWPPMMFGEPPTPYRGNGNA